jgi:ectoine hydroxylase-related dioxygenase (phytanoyl-CoA dioxygenase family)
MLELDITPGELHSGHMSSEHLEAAVRAIKTDGFLVLKNVVDTAHLDALRERMLDDLQHILARKDAPFNFNTGNVQQDPPPFPPYLFRDVLLNDMAIAVTKAVLGAGVKNSAYTGNTALPGGSKQPVHADMGQLWQNLETATPPYALVVNVPVVDMSEENGSTEIWRGTHLDTTIFVQHEDIKVPEDRLEAQRAIAPPLQPRVQRGSILIRDIRLWHRGMPNHTQNPRPMIAMIHWVSWWNSGSDIRFPKGTEAFFQHPDLTTTAEFVDGEIDYLHHNQAFDLQKS